MKVVCVATEEKGYYAQLRESCLRYEIPFVPLLKNKKWTGYGDKITAIHEYLETQEPGAFLLFVDAYDTVLLSDPNSLIEQYKSIDPATSKIWISTEQSTAFKYWTSRFIMGECEGSLLNSGTYFAQAGTILEMTTKLMPLMQQSVYVDDQKMITNLCQQLSQQGVPLFLMDHHQQLAQVCDDENSRQRIVDLVRSDDSNLPAVAHFTYNGNMDPLMDALGYSTATNVQFNHNQNDKRSQFVYFQKLLWHHIKYIYYNRSETFYLGLITIIMILVASFLGSKWILQRFSASHARDQMQTIRFS